MSETTWTYAQNFNTSFQTSRTDLGNRLESAKSATASQNDLQTFTVELAKLTKALSDATGSLPSYDQRQCELQLKTLETTLEDLRASSAPKSKFAFKRKPKAASGPKDPPTSNEPPSSALGKPSDVLSVTQASSSSSSNIALSAHRNAYLTPKSLSTPADASIHASDLTISDLDGCVVHLLKIDITALHIRNVKNTVLILPIISGSVILHDLERCTVIVGCHQFRMHSSKGVDVYLTIPSNPIIEHSSSIRFAPYPASIVRTSNSPVGDNRYTSVQDFSHIRSTQSPNWSILPDEQRREDWPGEGLEDEKVAHILDELLPKATS